MHSQRAERDIEFAGRLARLLDTSFRVPGTNWRFGLDPLIGLFPFLGDLLTLGMSLLIVLIAVRNGAGGRLLLMMCGNILLDTLAGSIPVLGSVFDFFYRSNTRNMKLLREHFQEGRHRGSGKGILLGALLVLIALFVGMAYLIGIIISWFFDMLPAVYNWFMELIK